MRITCDPAKNDRNVRLRGLSFDTVAHFNFDSAVEIGSNVLCFTEINNGIRVISFRKANPRKVKRYDQARSTDSP